MTLEEAKEILKEKQQRLRLYDFIPTCDIDYYDALETVLRALEMAEEHSYYLEENRLPKDYVRENYIQKEKVRKALNNTLEWKKECHMYCKEYEEGAEMVIQTLKQLLGE